MLERSVSVLAVVIAVGVLVGCRTAPPPTVSGIVIEQGDVELVVGATLSLSVRVTATGGASTAVTWSSDDASVASVTDEGVLTAASLGVAAVTASSSFDPTVATSVVVSVVADEADDDVVTLVVPVAPLPGSSAQDIRLVSPLAETRATTDGGAMRLSQASFAVPRDRVAVLGAVDVQRAVGWTAVWPGWFERATVDASAFGDVSSVASAEEIGPLSTAVQMVFTLPGFYETDLVAARATIEALRSLPEVLALADALASNFEADDVLDVPAVELALGAAIDAAADALVDAAAFSLESAGSTVGERQSTSVARQLDLDVDLTRFYSGGGEGWLAWDPTLNSLSRAVTWLGYVYEIDADAFDDWEALRVFFDEDPWRSDVALVSPAPVGGMLLEPDTVYAYIDIVDILASYVASLLPGVGDDEIRFDVPDRDAVYAVHALTCSPHGANYVWLENHRRDAELLAAWPGGIEAYMFACITNIVEMALDAASLVVDTTMLAEAIAVGAVRGRMRALTVDALETADDPFRISVDRWIRTQTVVVSAIYEEVANRLATEGLKALLEFALRQKAKVFDVPGAAASVGKILTRVGVMGAVTPWEGMVIQVGDPWRGTDVTVRLQPSSLTLPPNGVESFTATVTGTADTAVTWDATCGGIAGAGSTITYTAPSIAGQCVVTAASVSDPRATASATVTVMAGGSVGTQREIIVASGPVGGADTDLYVISRDDGASRLLLDTPGRVTHAFWNAERNALLITDRTTDTDRDHRLVRFDEEGRVISNERLVRIEGPSCCHGGSYVYGWHPLGDSFLYKKAESSCSGNIVWRRGLDGAETVFLDPSIVGHGVVYTVDFHPNGREVLWTSQRGCWSPSLAIYRADLVDGAIDVSTIRVLLNDGQYVSPARYSPDGSLIAFKRSDAGRGYDGPENVYVMAADGSDVRALTTNTSAADRIVGNVAWSPDGTHVAFGRSQDWTGDRTVQVYLADVDGVAVTRVTDASGQDLVLAW